MARIANHLLIAVLTLLVAASASGQVAPPGMARIPAGVFRPLYRTLTDLKEVPVKSFDLDVLPVTNGDFLAFVRANPRWQRSKAKRIFADESYLKNWAGDLAPGTNAPASVPVTHVSWYAAKAYAQWKGKRLPTVAEWECAASASSTRADGENDPDFKRLVFQWYSTPTPTRLAAAGLDRANLWGVHDLHGLIWEWVSDFNTIMVTGDARNDGSLDRDRFCGAGAVGAKEVENFPAFMRHGFRSSLKADYCIHNLGFRCAKDP